MAEKKKLSNKLNMAWNSAGSMIYLGCQWLMTVLVVRLSSGYDAAGLLSLAMAVSGTFGTFANYKMGTYQITDVKHENTLGEYLTFRIITLSIAFVLTVVYALGVCELSSVVPIILFFVYKSVGLLIDIFHGTDQQHRRMDYVGISFAIQGVASLALFSAVFLVTQNLNITFVAMTIGAALVLALWDIPRTLQFEKLVLGISGKKCLFFFKTSLPAVIASVAASAIFMIPKQYLAMKSGDASLGIYSSVASLTLVIQMGASYLYSPLLDVFSRHYVDGERNQFLSLFGKVFLGIMGISVVFAIVLQVIGPFVLTLLFGESIGSYMYLLQPVIWSTVCTAFLWFFGDLLIAVRNFRAVFFGNIVAFVAVIPLTFIMVDAFDMNGVSFAGAGACFCGVAVLAVFLVRQLFDLRSGATSEGSEGGPVG